MISGVRISFPERMEVNVKISPSPMIFYLRRLIATFDELPHRKAPCATLRDKGTESMKHRQVQSKQDGFGGQERGVTNRRRRRTSGIIIRVSP